MSRKYVSFRGVPKDRLKAYVSEKEVGGEYHKIMLSRKLYYFRNMCRGRLERKFTIRPRWGRSGVKNKNGKVDGISESLKTPNIPKYN